MAIVSMKRMSLLALNADRDALLRGMQRMGCVEITDMPREADRYPGVSGTELASLDAQVARLEDALALLKPYDTDPKPVFNTLPVVKSGDVDNTYGMRKEILGVVTRLEEIEKRKSVLHGVESRVQAALEQMQPWESLDISPEAAALSRYTNWFAGMIEAESLPLLREELGALACPAGVFEITRVRDNIGVLVVTHKDCTQAVRAALDKAAFERENFTGIGGRTPRAYRTDLAGELEAVKAERVELEKETAAMAGSIRGIKILRDTLSIRSERARAAERFAATGSAFMMSGWVPADRAGAVQAALQKIAPSCTMEFADPAAGEEPPVRIQNNAFATAFQPVVEGFALPAYSGFDPTAIMAPFYACLFGMMVSDAGYGIVLTIASLLLVKIKKIRFENARMLYLLAFGGVMTVFWGVIYNSFFGFALLPDRLWLLNPVKDSLLVIGICIGFGAVHLFTGLGIAAYMNFKRGDPIAAISDQLSWFLLVTGLVMLAVPAVAAIGRGMAIAGAVIILLMKGRGKKNPAKRLGSGLAALYGMSGWLGDLLSYIRLFGMGLATGVIAMVFNKLIGMVWDIGIIGKVIGVVLFVGCHTFNLGINVLGAYVHSCRLQYIEFFGKFYEEGGRAFAPLADKTRYVRIQNAAADADAA